MPTTFPFNLVRKRSVALAAVLLAGVAAGVGVDRYLEHREAVCRLALPPTGELLKAGPWGEISCAPFTIAAPDEALPVRALAAKRTHWFFPNAGEADIRALLANADVPAPMRDALLEPEMLRAGEEGTDVMPSLAWLLELPARARQELYHRLAEIPADAGALTYLHKDTLDERFADSGVAPQTLETFHKLCCEEGDYLVFTGLETMLAELPVYEEKVRFLKALTRQKTLFLQLHVGPETDLHALINYWGKGSETTDVRTKLESLAKVKGGAWIGIQLLLPPLPLSQIYSYPLVRENAVGGLPAAHDCHWTSLNFFRLTPDPAFSDPKVVLEQFQKEYSTVPGDPEYGDVVLLSKPDGTLVHSAIYLADDIVYTKNGSTVVHPWMLSTTADLLKRYSFHVPPGERLTVTYLRKITL